MYVITVDLFQAEVSGGREHTESVRSKTQNEYDRGWAAAQSTNNGKVLYQPKFLLRNRTSKI